MRLLGTIKDVTIDAVKYDHCGPTKNGVTKCWVGTPAPVPEKK
jgi:hypothetical protein